MLTRQQITLSGQVLGATISHDEMALEIARTIRSRVLESKRPWKDVYRESIVITSSSDWPEPDFVFDDGQLTYAFEFKPPGQERREYVTGLGQALAYLNQFSHSTLIVPATGEGFEIADFISCLVKNVPLRIGLIAYDPTDLRKIQLVVPYPHRPVGPLNRSATVGKVFWAFWMDQSIHEFYLMLRASYDRRNQPGDIKEDVFKEVFAMMKAGKTYANDGRLRRLGPRLKFSSWFLNYKLPFLHCGLWSIDGKPTLVGTRVLSIADAYGWNSMEFRNALAKAYLEHGKHLLLIKYLWNIQVDAVNEKVEHNTNKEFLDFLASRLLDMGFGKAKRGVRRNLQAMISLWGGGLDILRKRSGSYYFPKFGLVFDWAKITTIIQSNYW